MVETIAFQAFLVLSALAGWAFLLWERWHKGAA